MTHQTVCETQNCTFSYQTRRQSETFDREENHRHFGFDCPTFKMLLIRVMYNSLKRCLLVRLVATDPLFDPR